MRLNPDLFSGVAALLLAACIHSSTPHVASRPSAAVDAREVTLARAAGDRVRQEFKGRFVVYPVFLTSSGNPTPLAGAADSARMRVLLAAFRDGAQARFADTAVFRGSPRVQAPNAERFLLTLTGVVLFTGDTATVDVYGEVAVPPNATAEMELLRYTFAARNGQWIFLNRAIAWSA